MMVGDWQIFIINNIIGRWEEEEEIKLKGVCERKWGKWYDDEQVKGLYGERDRWVQLWVFPTKWWRWLGNLLFLLFNCTHMNRKKRKKKKKKCKNFGVLLVVDLKIMFFFGGMKINFQNRKNNFVVLA